MVKLQKMDELLQELHGQSFVPLVIPKNVPNSEYSIHIALKLTQQIPW